MTAMPEICHRIRVRDRRSGATSDHRFTTPTVRIGREADSELQLADPFISAQHAVLESDEHGARLRDLGGTNGLRIAGKRLAPHTVVPVGERLGVSLGPYDLEILHIAGRDRRASSGALGEPGPDALTHVHARLRELHALHAPHVAARRAFEAALADAVHALHAAGDPQAARRVLAEFPATDHAHLLLTPAETSCDLSLETSPRATPDSPPFDHMSFRTSSPTTPEAPPARPCPAIRPSHLSREPAPALDHRPPTPTLGEPASPTSPALALLSACAHDLLPGQRAPANLDEARRFLERLTTTVRTLAAGLGALQHLRLRQARDLGVAPVDGGNPLLTLTDAHELLAVLLAWQGRDGERAPELLDCFAVLTGHARAHVAAALSAARHLAAELAPPTIDLHAPPGLLRSRARWHTFVDRYTTCLGDDTAPGTLRDSFRAAYLDELERHGLAVAPLST